MVTKMKTVAYIRVSTSQQATLGASLDAQREKIMSYATLYDLEIVDVIVDAAESAKSLDRPGLMIALDMLQDGRATALLVTRLDRLTRSVRDLGELLERYFAPGKCALMSVGEQIDTRSSSGRLVLNVLASVSQWEREAIGERTKAVMAYKASQNERCGSIPYGYELAPDRVHLLPLASEQAVIARARQLSSEGRSLRKVARVLAHEGLVPRQGGLWAPMQVSRMLATLPQGELAAVGSTYEASTGTDAS